MVHEQGWWCILRYCWPYGPGNNSCHLSPIWSNGGNAARGSSSIAPDETYYSTVLKRTNSFEINNVRTNPQSFIHSWLLKPGLT